MTTQPSDTMATNASPPVARRSVNTPQRGSPALQSLRWTRDFSVHGNIRSREFSPHMSPDRVTRNISPGRQRMRQYNLEVVSRVPQMYRTSFSAVTSPKRLPARTSPNQSNLTSQTSLMTSQTSFIATPLRATMPGRIQAVDRLKQQSCDSLDHPETSISNSDLDGTRISNDSGSPAADSPSGFYTKLTPTPPGAKYRQFRRAQSDDSVLTDRGVSPRALLNGSSATAPGAQSTPQADRTYCYTVSNEFTTTAAGSGDLVSPVRLGEGGGEITECDEGEVKIKTMIEKEYVHVQDVSFFDAFKRRTDPSRVSTPPSDKKKRTRSPFRWSKSRSNSAGVNANNNGGGGSEPASPAKDRSKSCGDDPLTVVGSGGGRAVRSTTIPDEMLTGGSSGSPGSPGAVKKSAKKKSKSITSFFQEFKKRLSPMTSRKQLTRADQCKEVRARQDSTGSVSQDSCDRLSEDSGLDQSGTPTHRGHKSKPIKSRLADTSANNDSHNKSAGGVNMTSTPNGDALKNGAAHPMPSDHASSRLLKSIEDNHQGDKSVYQAFKEKHSPKLKDLGKDVTALKPQAFKVVEFPDRILQGDQGHLEVTKSASEGHRNDPSSSRQQSNCTGSEPSLGSRNDNHVTSSVNASKRTLVSQENMSPSNRPVTTTNSAHAHHGLPDNPEGATTGSLDLQGSPEVMTLNFENSPAKTPSYLNASRLASGYTPYSSYTPVLQAKSIRATRQAEEDSQSDSSLHTSTPKMADSESRVTLQGQAEGHQSDQPISNGHSVGGAGDDDVDSSRIVSDNSVSGDNVQGMTSRTRNSTSRPSNGDLVGSRLSQGEGRLGDKENGLAEDDMRLNLTVGRREDQLNPVTSPDTPAKALGRLPVDGHYFIDVMRREEKRLNELCEAAEVDLQNNHSEDVNGKLRAAIGKANLLTTKKFKQFKGLCEKCNEPDETDPFPILPKDLVGFWDMVSIQVDDVTMMFKEIERMRLSGWTKVQTPTTTAKSSVAKGTARKSPRSKAMSNQSKRAQESSRARDLAREEARKRLLAAKKAGRMRKRSNSDKEEIEIYVQ